MIARRQPAGREPPPLKPKRPPTRGEQGQAEGPIRRMAFKIRDSEPEVRVISVKITDSERKVRVIPLYVREH